MPVNLNALIRYHVIDKCLQNRQKPCALKQLQEACSEALAEDRGIYKLVSERTIYDDLRVMKSDILGFNAPIECEGGYYTYSESGYSIRNTATTNKKAIKKITSILFELRDKVNKEILLRLMYEIAEILDEELPGDLALMLATDRFDAEYVNKLIDEDWGNREISQQMNRQKSIEEADKIFITNKSISKERADKEAIKEEYISNKDRVSFNFIMKKETRKFEWGRMFELIFVE